MAASNSTTALQFLQSQVSCPICLDYFEDPVMINCGHNFCRACITRSWEELETDFPCPQCRGVSAQRLVVTNKRLANVADLSKKGSLKRKEWEEEVCTKHNETLKLFCQEHQMLICEVCDRSREHMGHTVIPIEEAAQEYKDIFPNHLEKLKEQLQKLKCLETEERKMGSAIQSRLKDQDCGIWSSFEELKYFLESEKKRVLRSVAKDRDSQMMRHQGNVAELEKQQSYANDLITEIEGRSRAQDVQLLKEMWSLINRCDNVKVQKPIQDLFEVEKTVMSCAAQQDYLKEKTANFKETFMSEMERRRIGSFKVKVTLDPDTAHPRLLLSDNGTRVRDIDPPQRLPHNPKRFIASDRCVLGTEGFTSGRHYWEMLPLQVGGWYVGVAEESVTREKGINWYPTGGVWTVMGDFGQYLAFDSTVIHLVLRERPQKLGVFLDYEAGQLSMYNADTMEHVYTFTQASFTQRIFPFFCLYQRAELSLL